MKIRKVSKIINEEAPFDMDFYKQSRLDNHQGRYLGQYIFNSGEKALLKKAGFDKTEDMEAVMYEGGHIIKLIKFSKDTWAPFQVTIFGADHKKISGEGFNWQKGSELTLDIVLRIMQWIHKELLILDQDFSDEVNPVKEGMILEAPFNMDYYKQKAKASDDSDKMFFTTGEKDLLRDGGFDTIEDTYALMHEGFHTVKLGKMKHTNKDAMIYTQIYNKKMEIIKETYTQLGYGLMREAHFLKILTFIHKNIFIVGDDYNEIPVPTNEEAPPFDYEQYKRVSKQSHKGEKNFFTEPDKKKLQDMGFDIIEPTYALMHEGFHTVKVGRNLHNYDPRFYGKIYDKNMELVKERSIHLYESDLDIPKYEFSEMMSFIHEHIFIVPEDYNDSIEQPISNENKIQIQRVSDVINEAPFNYDKYKNFQNRLDGSAGFNEEEIALLTEYGFDRIEDTFAYMNEGRYLIKAFKKDYKEHQTMNHGQFQVFKKTADFKIYIYTMGVRNYELVKAESFRVEINRSNAEYHGVPFEPIITPAILMQTMQFIHNSIPIGVDDESGYDIDPNIG